MTLANSVLHSILEEARSVDPDVAIESAAIVDLETGWRVLVADIGPSTALYGVVGYGTTVAAQPPSGSWRVVANQVGAAIYVDSQNTTNGYPDLVYQNVRGVDQPFTVWTWDGTSYQFSHRLTQ